MGVPQEMQLFEEASPPTGPSFPPRVPGPQPPSGRGARTRGTNMVVAQCTRLDPLQMWVKRLGPVLRSQGLASLTHATSHQQKWCSVHWCPRPCQSCGDCF